jgi:hypothetical protein
MDPRGIRLSGKNLGSVDITLWLVCASKRRLTHGIADRNQYGFGKITIKRERLRVGSKDGRLQGPEAASA